MLAKRVAELPEGEGWIFEPKWDGFRVLVFRDGDELFIQSRDEKPLNRYFPELLEPLKQALPARAVVDGEVVVAVAGRLEFDALQMRVHPAASRVKKLADELPASVVLFDMLSDGERDLRGVAFAERRAALERALSTRVPSIHVTPATSDRSLAADWFRRFEGAGLDGVMAKSPSGLYEPGKRVMLKVKHERECDCVVAGFRWHKNGKEQKVGSLLLGLFDEAGSLHHVGVVASFTDKKRQELTELLAPYRRDALAGHPWQSWAEAMVGEAGGEQRMPGGKSRWSQGKDLSWEPLRAELVVEVAYDHMQGSRFRHTAQSAAGAPTRQRASAPTRSSRSCPRKSSRRSSASERAWLSGTLPYSGSRTEPVPSGTSMLRSGQSTAPRASTAGTARVKRTFSSIRPRGAKPTLLATPIEAVFSERIRSAAVW